MERARRATQSPESDPAPEQGRPSQARTLPERVLELQSSAGNAAVARLARAEQTRTLARQSDDWSGSLWLAAKRLFKASLPRRLTRNEPSTGRGFFDVEYDGLFLTIKVKVRMTFKDGSAAAFPSAAAGDLTWTSGQKEQYAKDWVKGVMSVWRPGLFTFYSTHPHWQDVMAIVMPEFEVVDNDFHYDAEITKIPVGAFNVSSVTPSSKKITDSAGNEIDCKDAAFDSEDLETVTKPGGKQRAAVHEAGHMLGLADEYISASRPKGTKVAHSELAKKYLGYNVRARESNSIMGGGETVKRHHSVTFREALERATGLTDWTLKRPKGVPKTDPNDLIDTNTHAPQSDEVVV